jgi:hypothetical protein
MHRRYASASVDKVCSKGVKHEPYDTVEGQYTDADECFDDYILEVKNGK